MCIKVWKNLGRFIASQASAPSSVTSTCKMEWNIFDLNSTNWQNVLDYDKVLTKKYFMVSLTFHFKLQPEGCCNCIFT